VLREREREREWGREEFYKQSVSEINYKEILNKRKEGI
jgi:hypothetical protein